MTVLKKAVIRAYDAPNHKANVQLVGSHPTLLPGLRVATDIPAADVVAGRQCAVLFLDPSNQNDAVVVTIHGANPSTPSGATVAASATVVSETAFGQSPSAGAASPYSRGDHTHGTPADPVPAHEAAPDPHPGYGALAQAETWAALQTFSGGIKVATIQPIATTISLPASAHVTGALAVGSYATPPDNGIAILSEPFTSAALGANTLFALAINPYLTLSADRSASGDTALGGILMLYPSGHTLGDAYGLSYVPYVANAGAVATMFGVRSFPYVGNFFGTVSGTHWGAFIADSPVKTGFPSPTLSLGDMFGLYAKNQGLTGVTDAGTVHGETHSGATNCWQLDLGNNPSKLQGPVLIGANAAPEAGYALELRDDFLLGAYFQEIREMTAPDAPAANAVRLYAEDNGSGKTRLMARFASGAAQQLAIEP